MFGGQQITGDDDTLRVADVSLYSHISYARAENVKASSTLIAADQIVSEFIKLGIISSDPAVNHHRSSHQWSYLKHNSCENIGEVARILAGERGFPIDMAELNNSL